MRLEATQHLSLPFQPCSPVSRTLDGKEKSSFAFRISLSLSLSLSLNVKQLFFFSFYYSNPSEDDINTALHYFNVSSLSVAKIRVLDKDFPVPLVNGPRWLGW